MQLPRGGTSGNGKVQTRYSTCSQQLGESPQGDICLPRAGLGLENQQAGRCIDASNASLARIGGWECCQFPETGGVAFGKGNGIESDCGECADRIAVGGLVIFGIERRCKGEESLVRSDPVGQRQEASEAVIETGASGSGEHGLSNARWN